MRKSVKISLVVLVVPILFIALKSPRKVINHEVSAHYSMQDPQFMRTIDHLMGPPIVSGNRITPLQNGDMIFPAMLDAIRGAKKTITFETYIYWSGKIGKEFSDALSIKARQGVKVSVILDWFGSSKVDEKSIEQMKESGVQVVRYRPLSWYNLSRLNHRTHRKILVIDGYIGFIGGVGIADVWLGNAESESHWRDSHFKVEGPVVAQLQAAFMDNWNKTRPEVLNGEGYFPVLEDQGNLKAQVFKSSFSEGGTSARLMYLLSVSLARSSIQIATAYFVTDDWMIQSLINAKKRGVKVQILVPGKKVDSALSRKASRAKWGELLKSGIEIYEYQPTMFHCKYMIADTWVSVGSANFDNLSFQQNDEANLNVFDADFAKNQTLTFEKDLQSARRITWEEWRDRPFFEKIAEKYATLFESQM